MDRDEARNLAAHERRTRDRAMIRFLSKSGMSRRKLIQIYGADLVDLVLAH